MAKEERVQDPIQNAAEGPQNTQLQQQPPKSVSKKKYMGYNTDEHENAILLGSILNTLKIIKQS